MEDLTPLQYEFLIAANNLECDEYQGKNNNNQELSDNLQNKIKNKINKK